MRTQKKATLLLLAVIVVSGLFTVLPLVANAEGVDTYDNLYASVQGETNAAAAYRAFANKAEADGYPVIARLFRATADAEAKHADDEWAILVSMGATVRPVAATPTVGTTLENLQAAFDGETYEYIVMYPTFLATAQAEGMTEAARIIRFAMGAEQVHAGNFTDVRALL
jgi:rubrerythrin